MQKYDPFYGLEINCRPEQHSEYMDLKEKLEDAFHESVGSLKSSEHKGITVYKLSMENGKSLSFLMNDTDFKLAVYDRHTNELSSKCEYEEMKRFSETKLPRFTNAIESYAKQEKSLTDMAPQLSSAWGHKLVQDRMKTQEEHQQKHHMSKSTRDETVELMAKLYKKDKITFGHSMRVGQLAGEFWLKRGADPYAVEEYKTGAMLHDIGKLSIPDEILKKNGMLTNEEFSIIQGHSENGLEHISENMKESSIIVNSIEHHHEAYAGDRGYPDKGMHGKSIPEEARVLAVIDVYDALSSKRPYKQPIPQKEVFRMMKDDEKLDKSIVNEFTAFMKEREMGKDAISHDIALSDRERMAVGSERTESIMKTEPVRQMEHVRQREPERQMIRPEKQIEPERQQAELIRQREPERHMIEPAKQMELERQEKELIRQEPERHRIEPIRQELIRQEKQSVRQEIQPVRQEEIVRQSERERQVMETARQEMQKIEPVREETIRQPESVRQMEYTKETERYIEPPKVEITLGGKVDAEPAKSMTMMDMAQAGDPAAEDIMEDFYGMDIGGSGYEDISEKEDMGLVSKGRDDRSMDDIFRDAKERAEASKSNAPAKEHNEERDYDPYERVRE